MPPRSRSTAAVHATSRPIPQATHHRTTHVRACLRTCVRRCAARSSRRRPASSDRVRHQARLVRAGPSRDPARRARRKGGEEHQHHHTTRVRTCVRITQPQEARLERPSSPSRNRPASSEQAHRASSVGSHLEGRREGRSAVTSPPSIRSGRAGTTDRTYLQAETGFRSLSRCAAAGARTLPADGACRSPQPPRRALKQTARCGSAMSYQASRKEPRY